MRFTNLNLDGQTVDLVVENGTIKEIVPAEAGRPCRPVVPAFYNCHTHLAMNLLRGYADDLELMPWLQEHIWPAEAHLTDEIVYAGTRLAILEMIRCGTVFANDMYWYAPAVARAAEEMGIRCAVSMQTIETGGPGHNDPKNIAANNALAGLPRDASQQALAGREITSLAEATANDLMFFHNEAGKIVHVGIYMGDNKIIHASGRVRIDTVDNIGIMNCETGQYSHKLCSIRRITL